MEKNLVVNVAVLVSVRIVTDLVIVLIVVNSFSQTERTPMSDMLVKNAFAKVATPKALLRTRRRRAIESLAELRTIDTSEMKKSSREEHERQIRAAKKNVTTLQNATL